MRRREYHAFRRKREGKTDYNKRLRLLKANKPRVVIRLSLKNIIMQVVEFHPTGDKILASASTKDLQKQFKWDGNRRNTPAAYLTGLLLAKKAQEKKIKEAIVDLGLQQIIKGSVIAAAIKGAADGGLNIPHSPEIFPSDERIQGKHIKFKNTSFDTVKGAISK